MALGTEAPSTGSQREPSRFRREHQPEADRTQSLPTSAWQSQSSPCSTLPAPHFTSRCWGWMSRFDFELPPRRKFGWQAWNERTVFVPLWAICHTCADAVGKVQWWDHRLQNLERISNLRGLEWDRHVTSALRSSSRVQNTNTNCPHNTGLLSDRKGRYKKRRSGGSCIRLQLRSCEGGGGGDRG